ncbi:heat-inducible transcriptional repressor HrcA [Thiomicrorhabdus lithotrophica]|uniref:Heat-inducible transcription repressor HrcA n=1 Tax=Thiomicrorhabdus lithotrophica TaxID=2949997 RepID=A0ABY8CBV7_9GAMM|nr:heat-inducible transcriptional repressor HrcA [Thiomicrorhabdus lithotrophica]WEJ63471.1 heat-inducible transcriptional repressor HrcA [Thiomicrorhabdus lithotrophica]
MLSDRSQLLFKNLMGLYLNDGKPVGSTTLAKLPDIGLSSATVRNVMADLEKMGLIHSPHTSAGRVPTDVGYRLFIDSMLTYQPLSQQNEATIRHELSTGLNQDALMANASKVLSGITGMTSLVLMPNKEQEVLKHIDFISLSANRVLVVLVFNDQDVQNRIIELEQPIGSDELQKTANFLNEQCVGKNLAEAKQFLMGRMDSIRSTTNDFMSSIVEATDHVLEEQLEQKMPFLVSGQTNLLNYQELASSDKLKALFNAFEQHSEMLSLLDKSMQAQGVQVFVGQECGSAIYQDCSIVTTPYQVEGEVLGVLGVVGPSRMDYQKVVPRVDMTAKILGSLLKK